jgi:hypothetical protein
MSINGVLLVREYLHSCAFAGMVLDGGESGIWVMTRWAVYRR